MAKDKWIACLIDEVIYPKTGKNSEERIYINSQVINLKKVIYFRKSFTSHSYPAITIYHVRDYTQWVYPTEKMRDDQYYELCDLVGIKFNRL